MREWVEKARLGDAEAFGQLMLHFRGMAFAVSYDMLKDVHLAEDAVQDAFIEAYQNLEKLQNPAAFPGWFKTIVVRQSQRTLRRKHHSVLPLDEAVQVSGEVPDLAEISERREESQVLQQSVKALSAKLRVPLRLFYFYGYSLQEISDYLGTPVPTLKKRLHDARRKLKGTLPVADLVSVFHHLYEGGQNMLHIVNGDVVGEMLKQGVVQGDVLVWREVYPSGPIFANPAGAEERSLRARVLEDKKATLAASGLPFAYEAFTAHLKRLPSERNGLGIVEQTTLQAVRNGVDTPLEMFRQVTDVLHVLGMGDLEYWKVIRSLVEGEHPLLIMDGAEDGLDFRQIPEFLNRPVILTELGNEVLHGSADRIAVQGIDEWFGGLHLHGHEVSWRWDDLAGGLVRH
ncbi:RNA polymerase sigma factor [Paenibacillus sp. NRS-1782]|uniref:RNA polymerase sigma factor n=1 Tax=unclassified Paenibacillus TaxID=185978 RepID=UPI003D2D86CE